MIFHNHKIKHICEETRIATNGFVFPFNPTMNVSPMGMTTQGDVAHFVVRETIWGLSYGYKILEGGHGWERESRFVPCVYNLQ